MDKEILADIKKKTEEILSEEIDKGYSPVLVVTPEQEAKTPSCRMCGKIDSKYAFVIVGRELPETMVYIYCIPMVCTRCHGNEVKAMAFLNRLQAEYEKKS